MHNPYLLIITQFYFIIMVIKLLVVFTVSLDTADVVVKRSRAYPLTEFFFCSCMTCLHKGWCSVSLLSKNLNMYIVYRITHFLFKNFAFICKNLINQFSGQEKKYKKIVTSNVNSKRRKSTKPEKQTLDSNTQRNKWK